MTPSRLLKILLAVTVLLTGVLAAFYLRHRPADRQAPFAAAVDTAEKMTLQTGAGGMELTRSSQTWTVRASTGPASYKADPQKIQALQAGLRNFKLEDVISERAESAAEFEVTPESATVITLYGQDGRALATGMFGKQAPDASHLYFRFPDKPHVYLARGMFRTDLNASDLKTWRDAALLNLPEDRVLTVYIEGPGFKTALARSSDTWSCNGQEVDPTSVWGMLGVLAHLRAADFVETSSGSASPFARPYASVTLQLHDGQTHQLDIGPLDAKNKRYPVQVNKDANGGWVPEPTIKAILQKPSDFKPKENPK